jgi:hypothetical protein
MLLLAAKDAPTFSGVINRPAAVLGLLKVLYLLVWDCCSMLLSAGMALCGLVI